MLFHCSSWNRPTYLQQPARLPVKMELVVRQINYYATVYIGWYAGCISEDMNVGKMLCVYGRDIFCIWSCVCVILRQVHKDTASLRL